MPHPTKHHLHQTCLSQLNAKIATLEKAIRDAQQAASEDTKSSAGDKFETSREMMKLEIDKNNMQLSRAIEMLSYLNKLDPDSKKDRVSQGSLVITQEGSYYFSVAIGKVMLGRQPYFALSMASPIGKALNDRTAGEEVEFMGRTIRIEQIM